MSERQIIDVERLVEELKERVARERAAGAYADDLSAVELEVLPPAHSGDGLVEGFDLQPGQPRVRFRPELGISSKPVIGPVITLVKKVVLRLIFFVMDDLARQTDAAVTRLEAALAAEAASREAANAFQEAAIASQHATAQAESATREAVQLDVRAISQRLDALGASIERLQLSPRLARLERTMRPRPASTPAPAAETGPAPEPGLPGASFDYLAFEARFRPEETVVERQRAYLDELRGAKRVADLGAGRGELVMLLTEAGVSAYGVEIEPDFVDLMRDNELEVVAQDAIEHLRGLEEEHLGGIVASHLVEHLPAQAVSELVALAADKLAERGVLILETPNPESLVAGSVNFHRDLTHLRPIHPDTLAFLCESAGFSEVEIRRLSPFPEEERLAISEEGPLKDVVEQLNNLLYGYQDYAIVARK